MVVALILVRGKEMRTGESEAKDGAIEGFFPFFSLEALRLNKDLKI